MSRWCGPGTRGSGTSSDVSQSPGLRLRRSTGFGRGYDSPPLLTLGRPSPPAVPRHPPLLPGVGRASACRSSLRRSSSTSGLRTETDVPPVGRSAAFRPFLHATPLHPGPAICEVSARSCPAPPHREKAHFRPVFEELRSDLINDLGCALSAFPTGLDTW